MANTPGRNTHYGISNHIYQAGTDNPTVVATNASAGSLYIQVPVFPATSPYAVWQKQDNGLTTNWILFAGGGGSVNTAREDITLSALDISNGYVDLSVLANLDSVICNLEGAALLIEGTGWDYTLTNAGVTRVVFDATLIPTLANGQLLQVQYLF